MITIKIYFRKHKKDTTNGVVWISFHVQRQKVNFSTKVTVDEKNWNEKKKRVSSSDKLADDKNLIIDNILARINNVFVKYRLKDKRLTRESFLRAYNRPDDYDTIFDYISAKLRNLRMELGTYHTGARPAQVKMILNALSDSMMTWLEEGHGVRFGKLGSFLPSVRSRSSENADEAGVKKVRVSFRPSRELSKKVAAISINTVDDGDEDEPDASQDGGSTEGGSGGEGQDFV